MYIALVQGFMGTVLVALVPIVAVLLVVGLATAFFQAAFQIEDATFSLLPKTAAMIVMAMAGGFGALGILSRLAARMILTAPDLIRQPWN
jgi:flagellar biosynthesis protein FliQ